MRLGAEPDSCDLHGLRPIHFLTDHDAYGAKCCQTFLLQMAHIRDIKDVDGYADTLWNLTEYVAETRERQISPTCILFEKSESQADSQRLTVLFNLMEKSQYAYIAVGEKKWK